MPVLLKLLFTVAVPGLYWGKGVQSQACVNQRKNYKTLIKRVKRISHVKSAGAGGVRPGTTMKLPLHVGP